MRSDTCGHVGMRHRISGRQCQIRVAGFGGTDTAIVEELIARFVQPNLKGITVAYEPIPDAYDKWIVNALSAGTGPDLFYVDIFWAQGLFSFRSS